MSVVSSFASATPPSSCRETITGPGPRYTVVARPYYDLCLEARAVQEGGAAGFDVSIVLLRIVVTNYGSESNRKEGSFPKEFMRVGAKDREKAPAVAILHEIKLKESLSRQEAERAVSNLAQRLRQEDGYADSLVEEMGYTEKIEQTKPNYENLRVERL